MVQYVSCSTYLIRCCLLLLLLLMTLLQIGFFTLIPEIQLYPNYCHNHTKSSTIRSSSTTSSKELQVPMHLFYQSLYLAPSDIEKYQLFLKEQFHLQVKQFMEEIDHPNHHNNEPKQTIRFTSKEEKALKKKKQDQLQKEGENIYPLTRGFMFSQQKGQGQDEINSTATYCINIITPFENGGIQQDYEIYLENLPSSRLIHGFENPMYLPPSVIDLYLERHPVDTKYYTNFHFPEKKAIWMMQNIEFFDRHELENPIVGVIIVKNRIGLKKMIEYRHRHRLRYSVFYTKHTSQDIFDPSIEKDWNRFLHLAGLSPFKNTKIIIQAWAIHPEWPELVLRVRKEDLCEWVEEKYGSPSDKTWSLTNVDYKCGSETIEQKKYLQNSIGIHLCPSETEGFGHYINEARSTGAFLLTTNVAPMNELVDEKSGVLIGKIHDWWWQTKGDLFMPLAQVTIEEMEQGIEKMLSFQIKEREKMGKKARANYLQDRVYFLNAMAALEESICQDAIDIHKLKPFLY